MIRTNLSLVKIYLISLFISHNFDFTKCGVPTILLFKGLKSIALVEVHREQYPVDSIVALEIIELEAVEVWVDVDLENWVLVTIPATIELTDINAVLDGKVIVLKWSITEVCGSIFECLFVTTPEVVELPIYFDFETINDVNTFDVNVLLLWSKIQNHGKIWHMLASLEKDVLVGESIVSIGG